jgi:hypothetical protein
MGRGEEHTAAGWHWLRVIAHLAIVVVFVLSALGYVPVLERPAESARADGVANRTVAIDRRSCDAVAKTEGAPASVGVAGDPSPKSGGAETGASGNCESENSHRPQQHDVAPTSLQQNRASDIRSAR